MTENQNRTLRCPVLNVVLKSVPPYWRRRYVPLLVPEARTLADDLARAFTGRATVSAAANASPHKFAWFTGDPDGYLALLTGRTVTGAASCGGATVRESYLGGSVYT